MAGDRHDDVTIGPASTRRGPTPFPSRGGASTPSTQPFTTGAIIAGRYRLVALLGKGGMGEVYRADDLTLDQPIALKFLPAEVGEPRGDARLAQFHNELRVARQVSHKNVCRLYDLGEADGRRFLTMEYVDGEDLGALLRRIGRFPEDRAIAVARQMCAGLAAAHERGVIHRDLKPANVMIDGEGNVRITDFGIATVAAEASEGLIGTPQYMAPEQLAGKGASIKSDLYALGLILFEIFTGKRARDAKTINELKALHDTGTVTTPSSIVRDLDPAVERVILRCLEVDPERRPASALAIAAALPGGDPLAAALAAGETPSPDVLAAAAEMEALPVGRGFALIAALAVSIGVYVWASPRASIPAMVPLEKPPAVLADRAQQLLGDFGYAESPVDTDYSFLIPPDFSRWLAETDQTTNRWSRARVSKGPALLFWYRTSPRGLEPDSPNGSVSPTDPSLTVTGQSLVILDTRGRLVEFRRVPPQRESTPAESAPDWDVVFRAAGLTRSSFTPVAPEWSPKDFADTRAAWEGPSTDAPDVSLRVEAAAYGGRVTSIYVVGPWARPRAQQPVSRSMQDQVLGLISLVFWLMTLAISILLARHNLRINRADRRGAARLTLISLGLTIAVWIVGGHHLSSLGDEVNSFFRVTGNMLLQSGLLGVYYLALEPYGRRFWPDGLLGWTRLFAGHVRDPRIGKELLIGSALGGVLLILDALRALAPYLIGQPAGLPRLSGDEHALTGPGWMLLVWEGQIRGSILTAFFIAIVFVALRLLVRRTWIAATIGTIVVTMAVIANVPFGDNVMLYAIVQLLTISTITFAIFRFGLLVTVVMLIVDNIPSAVPILPRAAAWAALPGNLSIAFAVAIACFGFYAARAGQPLFGKLDG